MIPPFGNSSISQAIDGLNTLSTTAGTAICAAFRGLAKKVEIGIPHMSSRISGELHSVKQHINKYGKSLKSYIVRLEPTFVFKARAAKTKTEKLKQAKEFMVQKTADTVEKQIAEGYDGIEQIKKDYTRNDIIFQGTVFKRREGEPETDAFSRFEQEIQAMSGSNPEVSKRLIIGVTQTFLNVAGGLVAGSDDPSSVLLPTVPGTINESLPVISSPKKIIFNVEKHDKGIDISIMQIWHGSPDRPIYCDSPTCDELQGTISLSMHITIDLESGKYKFKDIHYEQNCTAV